MQHGNDFGRFINLPYLECPHARALAPSLAANTGVASLVLTSNNMRDSGLSAIAAALQGNLALRKLRIVNTQVELRIVNTQAAVTATRLTRPPAPCNSRAPLQIEAEGAVALAALALRAPLSDLHLRDNKLGDAGLLSIAEGALAHAVVAPTGPHPTLTPTLP
jgi:hypothetical protein